MPQNAKQIYKELKNTYGNDIEKVFSSAYSSDSQCNQLSNNEEKTFCRVGISQYEKYNKEGFIQ